jgi:hypothetical protein
MKRFLAICLLIGPTLGCTMERPGYRYLGPSQHPPNYLYQWKDSPYQIQELPAPNPLEGLAKIFVPI